MYFRRYIYLGLVEWLCQKRRLYSVEWREAGKQWIGQEEIVAWFDVPPWRFLEGAE